MSDILSEITASRRRDYASPAIPLPELQRQYRDHCGFRPFRRALQAKYAASETAPETAQRTAAVIAEIKRGSPAKGMFAPHLDPIRCAEDYETGGAACLSVLTEPKYFFGSDADLIAARKNCTLPVLRKDFIVCEYQVWETALLADCMLLLARCLERSQLKALHDLASELHLDVLVEVFDESDIEKIAPLHFPLIGINNRNLATMGMDTANAQRFAKHFSADQTLVAASGIRHRADIESAMQSGLYAFLVGETLSRSGSPIDTLRRLVQT